MTMERVREAVAFDVELADVSTWLWLTSEQMGLLLPQRCDRQAEERRRILTAAKGHVFTYLRITWRLRFLKKKSNENRKCRDKKLEQA